MSTQITFDKDTFLNSCPCGCSKSRQSILDGIEKYKDSDPEMVKYLGWYRDQLWKQQVEEDVFREERHKLGDKEYNKKVATTLRAMADKIEQPGQHFIIHSRLPELPIFSGDDFVDSYTSQLEITLVAHPLGG